MNIKTMLSSLSDFFRTLLFPHNIYCLCCGDAMEASRVYGICDRCASKLSWTAEDPFRRSRGDFAFDAVRTCFRYGYYPRRIISGFKLGARPYAARPLARLLADRMAQTGEGELLFCAVPMHASKEAKRGFNQSELLARYAAEILHQPYRKALLIKKTPTASMRLSDANRRRQMQQGAFEASPECRKLVSGRHVVLVDDVVTTGSTADACARVLRECGAAKITVLCLAASRGDAFPGGEEAENADRAMDSAGEYAI